MEVEPLRVHSIDLPASRTSLPVPPELFEQRDALHKLEVLAIEVCRASGRATRKQGPAIRAAFRRVRRPKPGEES